MEPQFSNFAIGTLMATVVIGTLILLRKYPDGINGPNGLPSFSRMFMVCSACFGAFFVVYLTLVFTGSITFV